MSDDTRFARKGDITPLFTIFPPVELELMNFQAMCDMLRLDLLSTKLWWAGHAIPARIHYTCGLTVDVSPMLDALGITSLKEKSFLMERIKDSYPVRTTESGLDDEVIYHTKVDIILRAIRDEGIVLDPPINVEELSVELYQACRFAASNMKERIEKHIENHQLLQTAFEKFLVTYPPSGSYPVQPLRDALLTPKKSNSVKQ